MSSWTSRVKRQYLFSRDGNKCRYCQKKLKLSTSTLDHIVPLSLGGSESKWNFCLACPECNQAKANKPPHAFIAERMQGLIA